MSSSSGRTGTPETPVETAERLARMWGAFHEQEAAMVARWAPTLTPEVVARLERKSKSDEDMTKDELEQWFAAVKMTEPSEPPEHVIIDEGDEWPPDLPSHDAWDRWYKTPVWRMFAASRATSTTTSRAPRRTRVGQARPRGRRSHRARSPGRRTSAGDGDPLPLAARRSGHLRALVDAYVRPSKVWVRLQLEAEERLQRYSRGEDV